ncbi:PH domain-containing protein [Sphingomonas sp. R-74633]|uniref:PH domain-containing protein n=1 Tax=Sphingomonas sp. R-74633 TaxID=2751188 RepID=UPI0015D2A73D|nr:PH domain-containing protein [Sphingomonas sp. R-74633]NYT40258.1 PH domain-containing protein [Sphingomonas sp. R-74633]
MIESRLFAGEKLLWSGQPWQGLFLLRPMDLFLVPFSLLWAGFALGIPGTIVIGGGQIPPFPFILVALIFPIVGVYAVIGRFLVDAWLRGATTYAVTNQRVLIERSGLFRSNKSLDIDRLPALEFSERADGSGTIRFGTMSWFVGNGMGIWSPATDPVPQFLRIEHVRNVYELIAQQRRRG